MNYSDNCNVRFQAKLFKTKTTILHTGVLISP